MCPRSEGTGQTTLVMPPSAIERVHAVVRLPRVYPNIQQPEEAEISKGASCSALAAAGLVERFFLITYSATAYQRIRLKNYRTVSFRNVRFDE